MYKDFNEFLINEFDPCKPDKYIPLLEEDLKKYFGVRNAIAVSSGTSAIHLALASINLKPGDEVLVPSTTVIMSIIPILYMGARPIFVDCQMDNIDFDYSDLEKKITPKCRAIIPAYMWGCSYNWDKLLEFSRMRNLYIIEDSCQAHGSKWKQSYLGTLGHLGCFSLKNGKLLSSGEGGFILTNDDILANRCRLLRNHCTNIKDTTQSFTEIAWNYRITEMQAYIARYNLQSLNKKISHRKEQTEYVLNGIRNSIDIIPYRYYTEEDSNRFSPVFFTKDPEKGIVLATRLSENGVVNSTGTFGLIPANQRRVFRDYYEKYMDKSCLETPNSNLLLKKLVAISISENSTNDQLEAMIDKIIRTYKTI